ncbi:putative PKS/NRPS-like protein biosynthetic cluster, partial [Arthroderma sp. PD_2]
MAVGLLYEEADEFCQRVNSQGRIQIAAVNSASSITLSGDKNAVDEAIDIFKAENKFARKLTVDTAYHSIHMAPCANPYLNSIKAFNIKGNPGPGPKWFSSVSGQQILKGTLTENYWVDNMCKMVLFSSAITQAVSDAGPFDLVIEVGPHPALKGPATAILEEIGQKPPYTGILSRRTHDVDAISMALGNVWTHMGPDSVDFDRVERLLSTIEDPRRVLSGLPAYPFDRQRSYWTGSRVSNQHKHRQTPPNPLLGILCPAATTSQEFQWRNILQSSEIPWLTGHRLQGQVVFPATGYVAMAVEAMKILAAQSEISCFKIDDLDIRRAISFKDEGSSVEVIVNVTSVKITDESITAEFTCHSILPDDITAVLSANARLTAELGSATADILPCYPSNPFNLAEVNKDEFYRNLTKLGHDYSHPFRGVSNIKRKPDYSTGLIEDQSGAEWEDNLVFHPGMLDTGLQTTLAAWSFPGDGQIWSLHVPTYIASITLNPYFSPLALGRQRTMEYESFLRSVTPSGVVADVHIYTEGRSKALVQFEGASIVPFSSASAADDVPLFSNFHYKLANPDGYLAAMGETIPSTDVQLYLDTERISYWYIRNVLNSITPEQREHILPHFKFYLRWCEHMVDMVARGAYPKVPPECSSDTRDDIANLIERYKSRKDVRFVEVVGDNLVNVILDGTSMLEYMNQEGRMLAVYEDGLAAGPNNRWLGRIMAQIPHRYPRMHILEIGAGTGASAGPVLAQLGSSFSTYTFTDVSSGFFPEAKERFKDYSQSMIFKAFNIEQPPSDQGFEEGHYDVAIAANVLHVSADITKSMKNVRRLLKPGGYLIGIEVTTTDILVSGMTMGTLPGWWIGAENGRPWGPSLTLEQWDSVLRSTGFSGVDTTTPDISAILPVSVFVSQAIDEKITLQQNPLEVPTEANLQTVAIIGGITHSVYELSEDISRLISGKFANVFVFETVEELMASEIALTPGLTALSLTDLDTPFMKNLTAAKFTSLKALFSIAGTLVWVSRGSREYEPYSYMMVGIGRTVKNENPNINLQLFDIDSINHSTSAMLAEALIRHYFLRLWDDRANDLLLSAEPEVIVQDGHELIPRILPNDEKNKRYNSHHREITKQVKLGEGALQIASTNGVFEIQELSPLRPATHLTAESITIRTTHSLLRCLKVGTAGSLMLSYGLDLAFSDPIIALSDSTVSPAIIPSKWCVKVKDLVKIHSPLSLLVSAAAKNVAEQIFSIAPERGTVVVNDAEFAVKSALKTKAHAKNSRVVFTSSQRHTDGEDSIYIHPNSSLHS